MTSRSSPPSVDCYLVEYRTDGQWFRLADNVAAAATSSTSSAPGPIHYRWTTASRSTDYRFRVTSISSSGPPCRPAPSNGDAVTSVSALSVPSEETVFQSRGLYDLKGSTLTWPRTKYRKHYSPFISIQASNLSGDSPSDLGFEPQYDHFRTSYSTSIRKAKFTVYCLLAGGKAHFVL